MRIRPLVSRLLYWLVLLICAAVFVLPYLFMFTNSMEEFSYVLPAPPHLWPARLNFAAYEYVLIQSSLPRAAVNSVVVTLMTVLCVVTVSTLSAYGFARIDFMGREILFRVYLLTLILPGFLSIIPQYLVLQSLGSSPSGLIGTKAGLILLYTGVGICGNTFFLRGHFAALPTELEESVKVDGGSNLTVFLRVMLPLMLPSVATLAIFAMQGTWEEFFSAKVVLGGAQQHITLPLLVQTLRGQHATRWEWIFAASVLTQLPMLAFFFVFQRRFVISGIGAGSVKG